VSLGIVPAGITRKHWTSSVNSLDYLWHNFNFFPELKEQNLAFYYGLGGKFCFDKKGDRFGLRMVFGVNYIFAEAPFDFFLELSPTLQLSPETDLEIDPAIGIRYFFH